jgi:hypothetical protein
MTANGTDRKAVRGKTPGVVLGLCIAGLLLSASAANANTYLFSFTGQQALNALEASVGSAEHAQSAYYQLFLQPNPAQVSGYSYTFYVPPTPNATDPWETATITDPAAPELGYDWEFPCEDDCTWVRWGKGYFDEQVAVLTTANFFLNAQWGDAAPEPYGWGSGEVPPGNGSTITSLLSPTAVFTFGITTNQLLSGTYTLNGRASALVSGSPTSFGGIIKDSVGVSFTLQVTAEAIPEPGTLILISTSILSLAAYRLWRNTRPARPDVS